MTSVIYDIISGLGVSLYIFLYVIHLKINVYYFSN